MVREEVKGVWSYADTSAAYAEANPASQQTILTQPGKVGERISNISKDL